MSEVGLRHIVGARRLDGAVASPEGSPGRPKSLACRAVGRRRRPIELNTVLSTTVILVTSKYEFIAVKL